MKRNKGYVQRCFLMLCLILSYLAISLALFFTKQEKGKKKSFVKLFVFISRVIASFNAQKSLGLCNSCCVLIQWKDDNSR